MIPLRRLLALAALGGLAAAAPAQYSFLVANTPYGSNPGPYTNGILRYDVSASGVATPGTGIAGSLVADPAGLALSAAGELYVGNRHGNDVNPGTGSVSTFHFDAATGAYVADGAFATGASGTHGLNLSPTTGELFAANVNGPVTRFVGATPSGTLDSGSARDVLISSNGLYAYVTSGVDGAVRRFSTATGALLDTYGVAGASGLHWGSWLDGDLYLADYGGGHVYDLTLATDGSVATATAVAAADQGISVAFSPDGKEMFVPGHTTGVISKFARSGAAWVADGAIATGVNMGDIQVVAAAQPTPEPGAWAALGLGAAALVRRRRRA